jgi:triacylglycerol lipase
VTTPQEMLHPEIAAAIGDMPFVAMNADVLAMIRGTSFDAPLSDAVARADHVVPGDDGEPDLVVRVHRPKSADARNALPCLYSIHGGGYVMGSFSMDDPMFDRLCPKLGLVGVSVEYRLAPETSYPGPLEDCYRGLEWVHGHAAELGIDAARIGVRGISAGGGLAAALALVARDRGEVPLAFQLLDCPMLDDRQMTPSSQQDGLPVWSRESNAFGWQSYLGELSGRDDLPCTAAPGRATVEELRGLPPAFVSVGSVDGFLDEDVDYALRLNRAGVPTELHVYPGACHGYQMAQQCEITRQSTRDVEDWLARQLRVTG